MKALLLLSGGIDSPVAAYLMKRQGLDLEAIHFSGEPYTDSTPKEKSIKQARILGINKIFIVPFGETQAEVVKKCRHEFFFILTRRIMYKVAEEVAKKNNIKFLVTGDNLGQVGSQTLENLRNITEAVRIPVLRPLLCYNKLETIALAEKIGTYEISKGPEMCSVLGPKHPKTKPSLEKVKKEEEKLDMKKILKKLISTMEKIDL